MYKPYLFGRPGFVLPQADLLDMWFAHGLYWCKYGGNSLATLNSCARSGTRYVPNAAGTVYVPFGTNVPAVTDSGKWDFEQRTNSIRNNSMVGAVAGTPGTLPTNWVKNLAGGASGLTVAINSFGTDPSGLPYIEFAISGTTTASNGSIQFIFDSAISGLTAQNWTTSAFVLLTGGSLNGVTAVNFRINELASGSVFVSQDNGTTFTPPSSGSLGSSRSSSPLTTAGGATVAVLQPLISFNTAASTVINFTIRIGAPQFEQALLPGAVVLSAGSAVTVGADVNQLIGPAQTALLGAKSARFETNVPGILQTPRLLDSSSENFNMEFTSGVVVLVTSNGTVSGSSGNGLTTGLLKAAFGFDASSLTAIANAGAKSTTAAATVVPTAPNYLANRALGDRALNGPMLRFSLSSIKGAFDATV